MKTIKILGTGCPKCNILASNVEEALKGLGLQIEVEKVTDMEQIMSYDIMGLPALIIDEKILFSGKILDADSIVNLFSKENFTEDKPNENESNKKCKNCRCNNN